MWVDYATGVAAAIGLAVGWVLVQTAWTKVFPGAGTEPDALARRGGCRNCDCRRTNACEPESTRRSSHE